jgi:hypothetical protein
MHFKLIIEASFGRLIVLPSFQLEFIIFISIIIAFARQQRFIVIIRMMLRFDQIVVFQEFTFSLLDLKEE